MTTTTPHVLKTDCLGRVKVSADYREAVLDEFERGAMSGQAFARHHGIKYTTFASWIQNRRRKRGDYPQQCPQPDNGETTQSARSSTAGTALTLAEVVVGASSPDPRHCKDQPETYMPPPPLMLRVGSNVRVEYSHRSQIPLLLELLETLNCSKSC